MIQLGATKAKVAASLVALGYKGERGSTKHCPLARALSNTIKSQALVDDIDWSVVSGAVYCIPLPPACRKFVAAFDAGEYPQLVG